MLAIERRNRIIEKLQEDRRVVVSDLATTFKVSEETIRRDLERLDKDGIAKKSYGGAIVNEGLNIDLDLPFNVRRKRNIPGKQIIARLVADMVEDGDFLMLDASSTAVFIAKALKNKKKDLTIVTNSIEILLELSDIEGWNVISSGGTLKGGYLALVGPQSIDGISSYNVEKSFFSCKGIDPKRGITEGNAFFAETKLAMMYSSRTRILTADSSKFNSIGFSKVCDLKELDTIVTDQKPGDMWMELFDRYRIRVVCPEVK
ncbi:MAG: DeoR/GlpR family DNA-binding transcription regulator [Lachnospiraceae bacterium]|nr:DeoR/GlpR family DNA-binding transcription regulator [Lachnospiraceae bacterium]